MPWGDSREHMRCGAEKGRPARQEGRCVLDSRAQGEHRYWGRRQWENGRMRLGNRQRKYVRERVKGGSGRHGLGWVGCVVGGAQ